MNYRLQCAALAILASTFFAASLRAQSVEEGIQLFNAKKFAEAQVVLLPYGRTDARAAYHLGRIEFANNDPDKAAEWLEGAVGLNAKSAVYYDWLARAYGMQIQRASIFRRPGLAKKTKNTLEIALSLDPDNLDVRDDLITYYAQVPGFLGGSKDKAREMLLEIKKRNAYRGSAATASLCAAERDFACVERELQGMVTRYPDSAAVYSSLAAFYSSQKQFDKAFAVLDKRLETKPDELTTLYAVGRTASLSGQNLDQGERALKAYLAGPTPEAGPAPAHVHYRLGTIYEKKGATDLAREEYRAALQLNPKHPDAQKALASLK